MRRVNKKGENTYWVDDLSSVHLWVSRPIKISILIIMKI